MLVGQIRGYLSSTDQTGDDSIHELWRRYVDACQQLNQLLDLCAQLLERAEWMEALRSAELEPNLFDCIAALEFPKRLIWEQMGCDLGWERLTPVSTAISDRLQAAWDNRKRLRPLLREHLRLAVARGPLSQRLAVMHQLADKDRMSTFWRDDIQKLEKARGPQLLREMQQAMKAQDTNRLVPLLAEIRETPWTLKLPASLRKLEEDAESLVLECVRLPETAQKLIQARCDADMSAAGLLLDEWESQLSRLRQLRPQASQMVGELVSKIRDAVGWAERITQTQSLVAEWHDAARQVIQASKSGDIPLREIRRLRDQAASLLVLIPTAQRDPSLAQAAEAAYQGNRQRIILARCVSAAMVAAAVLVPGVLITFFMMWIFS